MIVRTLLAVLLVGVISYGVVVCFIGYEAVSTGINPGPWWATLKWGVVLPAALLVIVLVWPRRRPPEQLGS